MAPPETDRVSCDSNAKKSFCVFMFLIFTDLFFFYIIYGGYIGPWMYIIFLVTASFIVF